MPHRCRVLSRVRTVRHLVAALAVLGAASAAAAQAGWRNPAGNAMPNTSPAGAAQAVRALAVPGRTRHVLVGFSLPVSAEVREAMNTAGVELLAYVGDNTFFAVVDEPRLREGRLAAVATLRSAAAIERSVKLHPMLDAGQVPPWAVVGNVALTPGAPEPVVGAYVVFHGDVDLLRASLLAMTYGAIVRDELETVNGLVVELPMSRVAALADDDAVQWIEPPLPRMSEVNDSNRAISEADDVQGPPYNLDGTGVTALIYDGGTARASHNDFGGRLTVHDGSGLTDHATHTSGTVGGSGASSGGQFRGMAPGVDLLSYGFQWDGQGTFLYTNPGDIESDYAQAINDLGADVSNNSIGSNVEINGFDCSLQGDYGVTAALIDAIVRGDGSSPLFDEPFRVVWSNGNERQGSSCDIEGFGDYYSVPPPAGAKNHITVGALNSNDDSMTSFSSWGPTDDGRIKPDVAGPGCQSDDDFGVTSTSSVGDSAYSVKCGTSMSGPTVLGLMALLLEDFRAQYPGQPDPRNSTVKAILAGTAQDRGNTGPDYQFGYGSVRIHDAIALVRAGDFAEGSLDQDETELFQVEISPGTPQLKVTLAWDDVPGTPNVDPALVNDLDLQVTGPGGTFFPWTLDPLDPGAPAVRTQADHTNNIEQVVIDNPASGTWTVEVRGFSVPQGPQPFSIAGSGAVNTGLFISLPGGTPDLVAPGTATDIDVQITAIGESIVADSPALHYRYDGGAFQSAPMQFLGGGLYRATLPAAQCVDTPVFYFSAQGSASGTVHNPPGAPGSAYSAVVGSQMLLFSDDFEADTGWTSTNQGASSGDWQRGVPVNDPGWDYDPETDGDGSGQAFLTQNQDGNTDVDDGSVTLISPLLDLGAGNVTISYEYYLRLTDSGSTDRLLVEISGNGDAGPWTTIADHDSDGGLQWRHHEITQADLDAASVTLTSTMKVRFTANDANPQSINESGVDGFQVRAIGCTGGDCGNGAVDPGEDCETCPQDVRCAPDEECLGGACAPLCGNGEIDPGEDCESCAADATCPGNTVCLDGACACPWDLDGDGTVGINDLLDLLAAWGPDAGHPADFDGDGVVGIADFLDLLARWGGCDP